jgi:hypothetical protein
VEEEEVSKPSPPAEEAKSKSSESKFASPNQAKSAKERKSSHFGSQGTRD